MEQLSKEQRLGAISLLREAVGSMTQVEFSEKTGLSRTNISKYLNENEKSIPRRSTLLKISEVTGMDYERLLGAWGYVSEKNAGIEMMKCVIKSASLCSDGKKPYENLEVFVNDFKRILAGVLNISSIDIKIKADIEESFNAKESEYLNYIPVNVNIVKRLEKGYEVFETNILFTGHYAKNDFIFVTEATSDINEIINHTEEYETKIFMKLQNKVKEHYARLFDELPDDMPVDLKESLIDDMEYSPYCFSIKSVN